MFGSTSPKCKSGLFHFYRYKVLIEVCRSFTVIFLYRFMLNLRGASNSADSETLISVNQFSSSIVGNLGAPLEVIFNHTLSPISMSTLKEAESGEYHSGVCPWDETTELCGGPSQLRSEKTQDDVVSCVNMSSSV